MRSSAGPDAWESVGGSTGTWTLEGLGVTGVPAARQLPRSPFCESPLSALWCPGQAGCPSGPGCALAGGRAEAG